MDFLDFDDVLEEEEEIKIQIKRNNIFDAFLIYYSIYHECNLEAIADISSSAIDQVKKQLEDYIVLDPYDYDHEKETYLYNGDFFQGNLFELEKTTQQYNQKYKGLFQKNINLIHSVISNQPITLPIIIELKNQFTDHIEQLKSENRLLVSQDGYEYTMDNERFNRMVDSILSGHDLYFWQSDEVDYYQNVARKIVNYFSHYENEIRAQLGYTFFYHEELNFHIATNPRTILIQNNLTERMKVLLLAASYLLVHQLHERVAIIVEQNYISLIERVKKELNLKEAIDIYHIKNFKQSKIEYDCLFIDQYIKYQISLLEYDRVVLSDDSLTKVDPNKELEIYNKALHIPLDTKETMALRRYYSLSKDNQFDIVRHSVIDQIMLYRRYYQYINITLPNIIPIYLEHTFKTSNNEKIYQKIIDYKLSKAIEEIVKHKDQLQILYMDHEKEINTLNRYYKKSEIVYAFHTNIKTIDSKIRLIITNQLDYALLNSIYAIYYIGRITMDMMQLVNKRVYLYMIQNSIDFIDLEKIYEQVYIYDQLMNDYNLSSRIQTIIKNGCYSEKYNEKYELNQIYHQYIKNIQLQEIKEQDCERELRYQGNSFQIFIK